MSRPAATLAPSPRGRRRASRWPSLIGLGTATPACRLDQGEVARTLHELWRLSGPDLDRWHRIVAGTGIDARCAVMPIEQVVGLTTAGRMEIYEQAAPGLAREAVVRALRHGRVDPARVTDLVVVSCTGFSAPGVDVALVEGLGLSPAVRRTMIGFMGCFGAIIGLRTAVGACRSDPRAVTLVVCVELCSLHLRSDRGPQNQVASAIFSDGAAAAVVVGPKAETQLGGPATLGRVTPGRSRLLAGGRDMMSWRITDAGFAMTLSRAVPRTLRDFLRDLAVAPGGRPDRVAVHPGGPGILDAADVGLGLHGGGGLEVARDILRRHGNMSSATVLFVLQEMLRRGYRPPVMLLAFGPGLSVEQLDVMEKRQESGSSGST